VANYLPVSAPSHGMAGGVAASRIFSNIDSWGTPLLAN
jgi:hypothetical protein